MGRSEIILIACTAVIEAENVKHKTIHCLFNTLNTIYAELTCSVENEKKKTLDLVS